MVLELDQIQALEKAAHLVEEGLKPIEVLQKHSILEPHKAWYMGTGVHSRHWPALRTYIADSKGWGEETAEKINETSDEVVSLLADPRQEKFQYRGLVVGYVQSGKTANMTAVIAKALDEGYNMVVVLAGLTNKLRQQTQRRMESDLVARYEDNWIKWTSSDDDGDFRMPANKSFAAPTPGLVQLCVLKKNVSPLNHFLKTIERTPAATLRQLRVLLIDDECDSASVNAASKELDMTAINERIRTIIKKLQAVTYVGYTATPFANVLINPYSDSGENLDDLYPRNFITALERPNGYFGAEQLFGRDPIDADDIRPDEEGLDMIREVPEDELPLLQPPSRNNKDEFHPQMTSSLQDAVIYFIAASAARLARGQSDKHMTMLVHTSVYTVLHDRVSALIKGWLELNAADLCNATGEVGDRLKSIWEAEASRLPDTITTENPVLFDELLPHIEAVLIAVETPVENGFSENRINYENGPKIYIVVGGTVLARGLTLEGLMVSYFLRTTSQYDTLLQMGRWFGYRHGYEDFPRIWMTMELRRSFRMLAAVEAEIRADISEYTRRNVTPMAFAVRIRSVPGMAITAANKMRHAQICDISYSGQHVQTIRFDRKSPNVIVSNWSAAAELLSSAERLAKSADHDQRLLYKNVPVSLVRRFLQGYQVHDSHRELSSNLLLKYVDEFSETLKFWNVGLFQPRGGQESEKKLGTAGRVRLINRAMIADDKADVADIKALMSRRDVIFDCSTALPHDREADWSGLKKWRQECLGLIPLLLLYAIDRNSKPKRDSKTRTNLEAAGDLIGFGIVFPGSEEGAGGYVSVRLEAPSGDELESLDEEVDERQEAGDVI
ncbi:hypothetical protein SuNHUV7_20360 (plasmid) [Pseudoseohaeicola sp. NH-UV-7]